MSRRRSAVKTETIPDPIFNDKLVSKFICNMMQSGKRSAAERLFYGALEEIKDKGVKIPDCDSPLAVFQLAVENVKPLVEVKSRRVGGSNYQVPIEVRAERRQALASRWLIDFARVALVVVCVSVLQLSYLMQPKNAQPRKRCS